MNDATVQEQLDDLTVRVRRQAIVIERLATEFHALMLVLLEKKILSLENVHAAERRLDLAAEIGRAREIAAAARDLESLERDLERRPGDAA